MGTQLTRLRAALVALLVGSGLLFAIGSTIERQHRHHEERPAAAESSVEPSGGESGDEPGSAESNKHVETGRGETESKILGIDTESVGVTVIGVVASLLLAVAVMIGVRPRIVLLCAAGFGLAFAAGDARELLHQLDESNAGLAAIAAILIVLHLGVAALAAALFPRRGDAGRLAAPEPLG